MHVCLGENFCFRSKVPHHLCPEGFICLSVLSRLLPFYLHSCGCRGRAQEHLGRKPHPEACGLQDSIHFFFHTVLASVGNEADIFTIPHFFKYYSSQEEPLPTSVVLIKMLITSGALFLNSVLLSKSTGEDQDMNTWAQEAESVWCLGFHPKTGGSSLGQLTAPWVKRKPTNTWLCSIICTEGFKVNHRHLTVKDQYKLFNSAALHLISLSLFIQILPLATYLFPFLTQLLPQADLWWQFSFYT